jgi:hypothetical protein
MCIFSSSVTHPFPWKLRMWSLLLYLSSLGPSLSSEVLYAFKWLLPTYSSLALTLYYLIFLWHFVLFQLPWGTCCDFAAWDSQLNFLNIYLCASAPAFSISALCHEEKGALKSLARKIIAVFTCEKWLWTLRRFKY